MGRLEEASHAGVGLGWVWGESGLGTELGHIITACLKPEGKESLYRDSQR